MTANSHEVEIDVTEEHERDTSARRRSRLYQTEGVVLRRVDVGEADRIVTVYTREYGKRRLIAHGIRKPSSRKAGHLESFTHTRMLVARGRNLDTISQAEAIETFQLMRANEGAIAAAALMAELVDRLTVEDEAQPAVLDLLTLSLGLLGADRSSRRVLVVFEAALLRELGYRPKLERCLRCDRELEAGAHGFDFESGGVICESCLPGSFGARPISSNALKLYRLIDRGELGRAYRVRVEAATVDELDRLLEEYARRIVGRDFAGRRVVSDLKLQYEPSETMTDDGSAPDGIR
jgi:DNA repair protein RecO (recombination protein O)